MGLPYPVAYRGGASRGAGTVGFRGPLPGPGLRLPPGLGRLPGAANDNVPRSPAASHVRKTMFGGIGGGGGWRGGLRLAIRLAPQLRALWTAYQLLQWAMGKPGVGYDMTGWTLQQACSGGDVHMFPQVITRCGARAVYTWMLGSPIVHNDSVTQIQFVNHWRPEFRPGEAYVDVGNRWIRYGKVELPQPNPDEPPVMLPERIPFVWQAPWVDPFSLPIQRPVPYPEPPPYRVIPHRTTNPYRVPQTQRQVGHGRVSLGPKLAPRLVVGPRGAVAQPGRHRPARPGQRVKERKVKVLAVSPSLPVVRIFSQVTEAGDLIDAVYEALPEDLRKGRRRMTRKLKQIYDHYDKVDIGQAIENIIENQLEDFVIGKVGQGASKGAQRIGWHRGFGIGPAI
nr:MAG: hypothetical protein [Microvirus sp.]